MKTPSKILMMVALSASMAACEAGDFSDIGEGEIGEIDDGLAAAIDDAEESAELPELIIAGGRSDLTTNLSVGYMAAPVPGKGTLNCSGQLITRTIFLTAAHCVDGVNKNGVAWSKVRVGWGKRSSNSTVAAKSAWKNPKWNGKVGSPFDIGMVVLSRRPAYVPIASIGRASVGQRLRIVGYGLSTSTATNFTRRSAEVTVTRRLSNGVYQTTAANGRTCGGDSGGGAFNLSKQNQVILITSYGPSGCSRFGTTGHIDPRRDGNWQSLAYVGAKFD